MWTFGRNICDWFEVNIHFKSTVNELHMTVNYWMLQMFGKRKTREIE